MVNYWDRQDSYILDAPVTEIEEVFEDSRAELSEEIPPHVEEENKSGEEEDMKEEEKGVTISEERLNITNDAMAISNEFLHHEEKKEEDVATAYGLFKSTSPSTRSNAKKVKRRTPPANLSTNTFPKSSLTSSGVPSVVKKYSPFKDCEVRLTRLQEKVAMEEVKEERKKVPQFGLRNLKFQYQLDLRCRSLDCSTQTSR